MKWVFVVYGAGLLGACLGDSSEGSRKDGDVAADDLLDGAAPEDGTPTGQTRDAAVPPPFDVGTPPDGVIITHPLAIAGTCAGTDLLVAFTSTVDTGDGNVFTAQLSGPTGAFTSFVNIGSLAGSESGVITATIPNDVATGSRYRVRVIATSPYTIGSDNGADVSIGAKPFDDDDDLIDILFRVEPVDAGIGQPVTWSFVWSDEAPGATWLWDFGPDATPRTSTESEPVVTYATAGEKLASLTVSLGACPATAVSHPNRSVRVHACNVAIPAEARVVTAATTSPGGESAVWVCGGGSFTGGSATTFFVEAGGSVSFGGSGSNTVYLKAGASLNAGGGGGSQVVIKAEGASVTNGPIPTIACPSIDFDRTNAPSPGCP